MNRTFIILSLIIFTIIPFSSAEGNFAYNRLYQNNQIISGINYSINVNSSNNWVTNIGTLSGVNTTQFFSNGGLLNIDTSWLSSFIEFIGDDLYCKLTGCTMTGDLIVNANVTADYFIGDGSLLTGLSEGLWESTGGNTQLITAQDINLQNQNIINVTNITLVNSIKDSDTESRAYFDDDGAWVIEA